MRNDVVVVGSYNTDLTIRTGRLPRPGETVIDGLFSKGGGGKGANQAVAAARAGADVSFVARVGDDTHGREGLQRLKEEHVNTQYVIQDSETSTGVAFILVDKHGENSIVVAAGANARLSPSDIEKAMPAISGARVLLAQLESPLDAVGSAIHLARRKGAVVMLNPAPAQPLEDALLCNVDIITPNRLEAEMITGMKISDEASLRSVARRILGFGIKHAIITLGPRGVIWATKDAVEVIPAYQVRAIDSTGAGDVFSGSLAAFLAEGMAVEESVRMAIASASISVTRIGAQVSAPLRSEVEAFIANYVPSETQTFM
jgi:ribokinase